MPTRTALFLLLALTLPTSAQSPATTLNHLADTFVDQQLAFDPTISLLAGLPNPKPQGDARLPDRSPQSIAAFAAAEQADLTALQHLDPAALLPADHATYAVLREQLEADLQLRVCRQELWAVNHFLGWQAELPEVAAQQPVSTPEDRQNALHRWSTLPAFVSTEVSNLRLGLSLGYAAPQTVVRRVLTQIDELSPADPAKSPFASPATRSTDPAFRAAFLHVVTTSIYPALHHYRQFLETDYLPHARPGTAITDLPHGPACYQAFLRANTTLSRSPKDVFDLGQQTVAANLVAVQQVGARDFGTTDIPKLLAAIKARPDEHFHSADELLTFSRQFLERSRIITGEKLIDHLPSQPIAIEPLPAFEEASGGNSRFVQDPDPAKPSRYLIQLSAWSTETRAEAEIVTVHETIPGHFLQHSLARNFQAPTRLSLIIDNSAYAEGWARYAELMGEQAGIYTTPDATVLHRLWPARGMVVDPGLNVFGWSRQQAIDYIVAAGQDTPQAANDLVDRIAAMPGQLTSYDSGGLEILALRRQAETALGPRFDLKQFNRAILDEGVVPLPELRHHIEAWIHTQAAIPSTEFKGTR